MRDIKLLRIKSIIKSAGYGGTKPIIITAEDDKTYVLKTREDGTNVKDLGIFNEVLAYQLHDFLKFDISPQQIIFLYIDNTFIEITKEAYEENIIEKESYEFISSSEGINIGIEYIENAMESFSDDYTNKFLTSIMRLDNYILNYDRDKGNPNILQDKKNKKRFYAIDYGNALADAMLYEKIVNDEIDTMDKHFNCNGLISSKRYVFRDRIESMSYKKHKEDLATIQKFLNTIIEELPSNWEPIKYKEKLVDIISYRLLEKRIFDIDKHNICDCLY